MQESHARSLSKAASWRVTGTLDTFVISWLITGHAMLASGIAATEVLTKVSLFYLHERAWAKVRWAREGERDGHRRSLLKAISWRVTGTVDTFLISWLITGQAHLAGGIAATEVMTKILLFYLHERAWSRVRWGRSVAPAMAPGSAASGDRPLSA